MSHDEEIKKLNETAEKHLLKIDKIRQELSKVIIGQKDVIDKILICFLIKGHGLIEGNPGLAKSLIVEEFSNCIENCSYQRIQFTPDMLPSDITGTRVFLGGGQFKNEFGPIMNNFILADEINRAPPKVHSALLQVMQKPEVTIDKETKPVSPPFLVLATQNPIESEGVYKLPEAQLDRFAMKINIGYVDVEDEIKIIKRFTEGKENKCNKVIKKDEILEIQDFVPNIHIADKFIEYIANLVDKTRKPIEEELVKYIKVGASSRGSINLVLAAKANALLNKRGHVKMEDIKSVVYDVLRHRLLLNYDAEEEGKKSEDIIKDIIENKIEMPT